MHELLWVLVGLKRLQRYLITTLHRCWYRSLQVRHVSLVFQYAVSRGRLNQRFLGGSLALVIGVGQGCGFLDVCESFVELFLHELDRGGCYVRRGHSNLCGGPCEGWVEGLHVLSEDAREIKIF
jgi:hypothetical protein